MFDVEERDRVRARVLALASSDPRVVSGAEVGSLALGEGARWSDLDLTFPVADGVPSTTRARRLSAVNGSAGIFGRRLAATRLDPART
jgi:hypothetical protein